MSVIGTQEVDNLIASDYPIETEGLVFGENLALKRGRTVAVITATGIGIDLDSTGSGGQELFYAVLLEDVTTGAGESARAEVALSGGFTAGALTFTGSDEAADYKAAARDKNCYFKNSIVQANGV